MGDIGHGHVGRVQYHTNYFSRWSDVHDRKMPVTDACTDANGDPSADANAKRLHRRLRLHPADAVSTVPDILNSVEL